MSRRYTRDQQRKYKAERKRQAARVADRLLGKKKYTPPDASQFFGGTTMHMPFQYENSLNVPNNTVRPSLVPWELVNEVKQ